jgi:hypothetical protein
MRSSILLALLATACNPGSDTADSAENYDASGWPLGELVAVEGKGILAVLETEQGPLQVLRVRGTYSEMGRQMGVLVGDQVPDMWDAFMISLGEDLEMSEEVVNGVYAPLLGDAWVFMEPTVPAPWLELIDGMQQAAAWEDDFCYACRLIALSNISDLNFEELVDGVTTITSGSSEQLETYYAEGADAVTPRPRTGEPVPNPFHSCSFFGAWGDRSVDGHFIGSRNLDWNADTGIAPLRTLTIFVPEGEGAGHPFATVGYAGMVGALAGLSSAGIAVSEVGSTGVLERLTGEPWVLRNLDILEHATDLDEALAYHRNDAPDGFHRPQTIGYNFMVGWGDPANDGAGAEGAVIEANGAMISVYRGGNEGSAEVHHFDHDGALAVSLGDGDEGVNAENDAYEIDAAGEIRTFAFEKGGFIKDENGDYIEDPDGEPKRTGFLISDALYRGDEALSHANRRFQLAANGPQEGSGDMMVSSGSYKHRYTPSRTLLEFWESGLAYIVDDEEIIADNGGEQVPVGLDEGVTLASYVAMDSNILSVVYDATSLELMVSYEQGTGDDWEPASAQDYVHIDLKPAFDFD